LLTCLSLSCSIACFSLSSSSTHRPVPKTTMHFAGQPD
jgi:hypothetical protein